MSATANTIWSEATTVDVAFARAVACHRTGQLAEAQDLYTAILRVRPAHADAHHNLGVLLAKSEHLPTSLPHLLAAIEADPTVAQYWLSYIDALLLAERGDEARAVLQLAREHGLHSAPADALAARVKSTRTKRIRSSKSNPAQHEIDALIALFNERRYAEGELLARDMIAHFPGCGVGYKVLGSAL
ncbi:MAG TPA: hypothetical protein VET48_04225, partial [Steroidobacteraceae bacterium]|nr:hypothetical protein [Steroidobacteraceae bacterium]